MVRIDSIKVLSWFLGWWCIAAFSWCFGVSVWLR